MSGPRLSIQTQLGHLNWLCNVVDRLQPEALKRGLLTSRELAMRADYSAAVIGTLKWLAANEADIRAAVQHAAEIRQLLGMAPEVRAAILSHGPVVAELAMERATQAAGAAS